MTLAHLSALIPDADYGFSMRMQPANAIDFFSPSDRAAQILDERRMWLDRHPERHSIALRDVDILAEPLHRFARETGIQIDRFEAKDAGLTRLLYQLGRLWEPDFIIIAPDKSGRFTLRAACVCFPSSWAPEEKLGLPVEAIHDVVPGLNATLGPRIDQFLKRMKPGSAWVRSNWGISSSPEFNQHPWRGINRLAATTPPESTWLRIEHQVLTPLADSNAIVFGIRLENVALSALREDRNASRGLRRALATMPDSMAQYKNLQAVRSRLIEYLQ